MASHTDETRGQTTCVCDVAPDVVDAGADMTLRLKVSCSPACDLRGHTLFIKDQAGTDVSRVQVTTFDGVANETNEFAVHAPVAGGRYTWSAVCPAVAKGGISYAEASTAISFTVKPHTTNIVTWDIPSPIVVGENFTMKVGIKCSRECRLAHKDFAIYDHEGAHVATRTLGGDVWRGTAALYFAEVELQAPAAEGLYTWSVKGPSPGPGEGPESNGEVPHAEGAVSFGVRVVSHPEYVVTVETIDKESQTPLSGARVMMHPYQAVTDERGIAEVRVAKGAYKLFVSQTRYTTFGLPVEVTADMKARAELYLEPVQERN